MVLTDATEHGGLLGIRSEARKMIHGMTESEVEQAALDILSDELGYKTLYGPDIAPPPEVRGRKGKATLMLS